MKGKNGIVDFSRARVSRKKVSPGRYGGNIAFFFGLMCENVLLMSIVPTKNVILDVRQVIGET